MILIDFDRMIKEKEYDNLVYTNDFAHSYIAPEAVDADSIPTIQSDIYSIGQMIYYIFTEKNPNNTIDSIQFQIEDLEKQFPIMQQLYKKCIEKNLNQLR